eukprot:995987-Amphidinium_carterae.1
MSWRMVDASISSSALVCNRMSVHFWRFAPVDGYLSRGPSSRAESHGARCRRPAYNSKLPPCHVGLEAASLGQSVLKLANCMPALVTARKWSCVALCHVSLGIRHRHPNAPWSGRSRKLQKRLKPVSNITAM